MSFQPQRGVNVRIRRRGSAPRGLRQDLKRKASGNYDMRPVNRSWRGAGRDAVFTFGPQGSHKKFADAKRRPGREWGPTTYKKKVFKKRSGGASAIRSVQRREAAARKARAPRVKIETEPEELFGTAPVPTPADDPFNMSYFGPDIKAPKARSRSKTINSEGGTIKRHSTASIVRRDKARVAAIKALEAQAAGDPGQPSIPAATPALPSAFSLAVDKNMKKPARRKVKATTGLGGAGFAFSFNPAADPSNVFGGGSAIGGTSPMDQGGQTVANAANADYNARVRAAGGKLGGLIGKPGWGFLNNLNPLAGPNPAAAVGRAKKAGKLSKKTARRMFVDRAKSEPWAAYLDYKRKAKKKRKTQEWARHPMRSDYPDVDMKRKGSKRQLTWRQFQAHYR